MKKQCVNWNSLPTPCLLVCVKTTSWKACAKLTHNLVFVTFLHFQVCTFSCQDGFSGPNNATVQVKCIAPETFSTADFFCKRK